MVIPCLFSDLEESMDNFCDCSTSKQANVMFSGDLVSCLVHINKIKNLFSEATGESLASSSSTKAIAKAEVHRAFLLLVNLIEEILKNTQGRITLFSL